MLNEVPGYLTNNISGGPTGYMSYFCIDRHHHRVNAVFLDGHAEPIPLANLWKLQWNRNFTPRDVVVPE